MRTIVQSSFDAYLAAEVPSPEIASEEVRDREIRLQQHPHSAMLLLAFPELDNAERWCWLRFGPMDGECRQRYSRYRVCLDNNDHKHTGTWTSHWYVKTDYDFGYCEFYFSEPDDHDAFIKQLPDFDWGEDWAE